MSLIKSPRFFPRLLVLVALIVGTYFVASWFFYYREVLSFRDAPHRIEEPVIASEAIVVLTGDPHRIPKAVKLLRRRASPLLIVSGTGRGATRTALVNQQADSAADIRDVWQKILLEPKSTSTIENAEETGRIVKSRKLTRLILVTSDYHMPRSLRLFRKMMPGLEILPYAVGSPVLAGDLHGTWENAWRIWVEFWKYFIFDHFVIGRIASPEA